MKLASSKVMFATIAVSLGFKALKEQKVTLDSIEDGKVFTLTLYSVHVPEWFKPEVVKDGTETGIYRSMEPKWEKLAIDAKVPVGRIDPGKGPSDFKATFPSMYLNKAHVRYTKDGARLKISCKAANEDTMVSYKVPKDTPVAEISHLFVSKEATPAQLRSAGSSGETSAQEQTFTVEDADTKSPIVNAWLGMQDFCIMLLEMREMFLSTLRDQMVGQIDASMMSKISREDTKDLATETSGTSRSADVTSPTTTIRIFNIGEGPSNGKLATALEAVVKKGRCLGTQFKVHSKVLSSQPPVVALVDISNAAYTKIRCFSFFEGNIIPAVEITEPRDTDQCNSNTEPDSQERQSLIGGIFENLLGLANTIAGAPPVDQVPFKMIIGSLSSESAASPAETASSTPPDNVTDKNVQSLCQRLTEDYLLVVRDDDITCIDCIFKYTRGLKVSEKTGAIAPGGADHNDFGEGEKLDKSETSEETSADNPTTPLSTTSATKRQDPMGA